MADRAGHRAPASVSDFLNGLSGGSSGRSSVSLNSLLSDYLQEMQELAEGKLLPAKKGTDHQNDRGVSLEVCRLSLSCLAEQGFLQLLLHTVSLYACTTRPVLSTDNRRHLAGKL